MAGTKVTQNPIQMLKAAQYSERMAEISFSGSLKTKIANTAKIIPPAVGYLVSSGMARGIDTAAHEGALTTGTVAVLAGGVDVVYPKENQALYERIAETNVVISEMPVGTVPQARHFPRRNRIISGAARGIVVIEAAKRVGLSYHRSDGP